ncbi:hypothetical protein CBS115989_971 [Aspergillus niger]|uniref:Calponin-homology (CH) domain-containing protein n=1 Tax=Aspergillus niger ATCC 13496 TaxID=1353008 RepID=A0A370BNE7_ASPNG|nr:hypothetical protein CBS115989_971 [Aspergillus niger]KAI2851601.1 hypothetical protein CBS11232_5941 [Aspergillus niger]KAI2872948.1 hypothetical protein CBS115988_7425 [Aspergillus niger]RDH17017.1 hypothetical protein M747DRAFT_285968 [Aspergillus niger ATCC 13496]
MSGFLYEATTPCPSRTSASIFSRGSDRCSSDSMWEDSLGNWDDTANVEFTTEIKQSVLTGAKPRRRTKTSTSFAIHEDLGGKPTQPTYKPKRDSSIAAPTTSRKTSLLAQPAQRFRPKVSFGPSPDTQLRQEGLAHKSTTKRTDTEKNNALLMRINGADGQGKVKESLKMDVRRNTVYIPPDDGTVASVFMGLFSPLKSDDFEKCMNEDTQVNSLESQIARKRQAKRSLASSAQRAPLRPSSKVMQESCIHHDIAGKNGGKENVPPGTVIAEGKKGNQPLKIKGDLGSRLNAPPMAARRAGATNAPAKPTSKPLSTKTNNPLHRSNVLSNSQNSTKSQQNKPEHNRTMKPSLTSEYNRLGSMRSPNSSTPRKPSKTSTILKPTTSRSNVKPIAKECPIILDSITNPALYEENWLSHQEVAITQLVNELLRCTYEESEIDNHTMLRHELLALYQGESFAYLHKRLQASLLYGAMSIPKDVLMRSSRLHNDLGLKRKFLDIWIKTYDPRALRAALEAVTGRKIPTPKLVHESDTSDNDKAMKRRLEGFLDAFLLQNQDINHQEKTCVGEDGGAAGRTYRRTVLRSIMMVILLDKARMCQGTAVPRRLFLSSSPVKSSVAVLQALGRFLLPSCGDMIKALSHLDCELSYEQHPLEEYDYRVDNLAVDLRDGVRLTRVVEMLLYPSTSSGELSNGSFPLSSHLKFPCRSRAVKLFNIKIALDALASEPGTRKLAKDIRAEDIVDGHREKTIALLWKLVSTWGLAGLVDWTEVRKEIERLRQKAALHAGHGDAEDNIWHDMCINRNDESDEPTLLLKQWASTLAHLKGVPLDNLSTSFSDGKIYESIIDEYEGYIVDRPESYSRTASLDSRLRALGCSAQFAKLVAPSSETRIVDSDFTIGALAFLCSRLLPATKRARAATVLQSAWRRILTRRDDERRAVARDIARQCAAVVQTQHRILWAKEVIVRWWRQTRAQQRRRAVATQAHKDKRYL